MEENKKQYWQGLEQLTNDPEYLKYKDKEFPEYLPVNGNRNSDSDDLGNSSRRDFLKIMGFSVAAASLAACETPVRKAIPYLNKPSEVDPGIPNYYASTYVNGGDYCSIVVKTREGRPIKIEGNTKSSITKGGTSARVEASVLSLYDKERLTQPKNGGADISWEELDQKVLEGLASSGRTRIISNSILSPTTKKAIRDLKVKYSGVQHISYDPHSLHGIAVANQKTFGVQAIPAYDFSKAKVVVSFGADFLGTWLSPIEFTKQYSQNRKLGNGKKSMSRHYQYESILSLTGANADYRIQIKPSQEGLIIGSLYNLIAAKASAKVLNTTNPGPVEMLERIAGELWESRGAALVVSGSNDPDVQVVVNAINSLLRSYGSTIDMRRPVNYRQGNDYEMADFVEELQGGRIEAVIFLGCNPVYDYFKGAELAKGLEKAKLKVSTSSTMDETASLVQYVAPDHHFLESWDDAEPKKGSLSLSQPTITPLFNTRQSAESLLAWAGSGTDYYSYLRDKWRSSYFNNQSKFSDFDTFWDTCLYNGVYETGASSPQPGFEVDFTEVALNLNQNYNPRSKNVELILYQKVAMGTGSQANNPWLQEMPDPISKATWDNYLTIPMSLAKDYGIVMEEGMFTKTIDLIVKGNTYKVPALVQPGQAEGTIGLALGYGREKGGIVANGIGINAFPFVTTVNGNISLNVSTGINIEPSEEKYEIAHTQTSHTYMERGYVIQEATLDEYKEDPKAGRDHPQVATATGEKKKPSEITLWKHHDYPNHHWGMVIDLNSCTGCGACTIACQSENNIPVVGKEEVKNRRDMHWIRIDRYYSSPYNREEHGFKQIEEASDNPDVTFQPMMCQHCNNAPCESVCPVAATTHSSEGLNQMTYNRCIGTRYCANNCPYKVRRFNWFKYHDNSQFDKNSAMNNDLGKMVLNPDVVVRSRGVMEKCTLCVHRIQSGKLKAKIEKRRPNDSDINTACAASCPADAIVFGDIRDPESKISKTLKVEEEKNAWVTVGEERAYHVLEYLNINPNVFYLTKIRNKDKA